MIRTLRLLALPVALAASPSLMHGSLDLEAARPAGPDICGEPVLERLLEEAVLLAAAPPGAAPASAPSDSASVAAAAARFLAAFDELRWDEFAAAWAADATVFMPDARQPRRFEGRDAVLAYFRQMFAEVRARAGNRAPTLGIRARMTDLHLTMLGPGAALTTFHLGDDPPARRTVVWRREGPHGPWRIVHLHASRLAPAQP